MILPKHDKAILKTVRAYLVAHQTGHVLCQVNENLVLVVADTYDKALSALCHVLVTQLGEHRETEQAATNRAARLAEIRRKSHEKLGDAWRALAAGGKNE